MKENPRYERGQQIAGEFGMIRREHDTLYLVRSQTIPSKMYVVQATMDGWTCDCPDHTYRKVCCKHIHAVEVSRMMRIAVIEAVTADAEETTPVIQTDPAFIIKPVATDICKHCDSPNIIKDSIRRLKRGPVQRYRCKDCKKRFTFNTGFEGKWASPENICTAVELVFSGLSSRKAATVLKGMGVRGNRNTILNWAEQYANLMEAYLDKVRPQVGEAWRTDELYIKIRGNKKYLFAMLDSETRYWIAKQVATHKGTDDVKPMFRDAKKIAGKVPTTLISDGAHNFHEAWKDEYRAKNFLHKPTWHINEVTFDGKWHNNMMEAFNGNTLRHREKVIRGLKKDDSAIITGLRIYHNHVRPHLGLDDNRTPGEAAGIKIDGANKIRTIIEAAVKSELAS